VPRLDHAIDGGPIVYYFCSPLITGMNTLATLRLRRARSPTFNVGNGGVSSVRQVIETTRRVTGHPIPTVIAPRRAGDPASLVASPDRINKEPGWLPLGSDLEAIVPSTGRGAELIRVAMGWRRSSTAARLGRVATPAGNITVCEKDSPEGPRDGLVTRSHTSVMTG